MSPASAGGFFPTEPTRGAPCLISFHSFLVEKASALLASLLPQKVGHLDLVHLASVLVVPSATSILSIHHLIIQI